MTKFLVILAFDETTKWRWIEAKSQEDAIERLLWPDGREEVGLLGSSDSPDQIMIAPESALTKLDIASLAGNSATKPQE